VSAVAPAPTAAGPRPGEVWRAARTPVAVALLLVVLGTLLAVARSGGNRGELDPAGIGPAGSRALATLLRDRGTDVRRVYSVEEALRTAGASSTVFVPLPQRLRPGSLPALADRDGAGLVLVEPDGAALRALAGGVRRTGSVGVDSREAACTLPAAEAAGSAELGGTAYTVGEPAALQCYAAGGRPTLVSLATSAGPVTVVGAADLFTNDRLDDDGNAALALGLLGQAPRLLWLLPRPGQLAPAPAGGSTGLVDLLPDRLLLALGQVAVAVVLFALWRGRRLGPVVAEPLPVVVRSAESVEGRARLYRAAGARTEAAGALRDGTRSRLGDLLGRPPDDPPAALVDELARRTGRPGATVGALLYGADRNVPDDAALVRLAGDLDALEREVRRP
jgi:hypothetical protein